MVELSEESSAALGASAVPEGSGSGSRGAGGGVVSIVQPIHPEITSTNKTKSSTGIPTAKSCQYGDKPTTSPKNATRYTIATIIEIRKMAKP